MKTVSAALKTHIAGDSTTLATCWKITTEQGDTIGFTDHLEDITFDSVLYEKSSGFSHTTISQSAGLSVDNLDIAGFLESDNLDFNDIRAGLLENAQLWIFEINYNDLTQDEIPLDYGNLGEAEILSDGSFQVEFRSLMQRLDQETGDKYSRFCKVRLGSAKCGIVLEPTDWIASTAYSVGDFVNATVYDGRRYICTVAGTSGATEPTWNTTIDATTTDNTVTWTALDSWTKEGTITAITSQRKWKDSARTETADWFKFGVVTFTSGLNNGLSFDIKGSTATGEITQVYPAPFTFATGDGYKMSAGCNHLLKAAGDVAGTAYTGDCRAKFDNVDNFRGEPEITGLNYVLAGERN